MTKARAWLVAFLLILAWTLAPDGPKADAACVVRYVEGLDGRPMAQFYDLPDTAMED